MKLPQSLEKKIEQIVKKTEGCCDYGCSNPVETCRAGMLEVKAMGDKLAEAVKLWAHGNQQDCVACDLGDEAAECTCFDYLEACEELRKALANWEAEWKAK